MTWSRRIGISVATVLLAVVAIACAGGLLVDLYRLTLRVPINVDEGWNALRAVDAMSGRNLYLPDGFANFPNYPPLSFYLIGWFGRLIGDNIFAGRIVAFAAMLLVAGASGRYALAMGAGRFGAAAAAIVFLAFADEYFRNYVGMNDPQWLGHALQAGGLLLVLRWSSGRGGTPILLAAALLIVAGLFIKHNLLPVPMAVTIWLLLTDRRRLAAWLAAAGGIALVGAALCYVGFGWAIVQQVVLHRRLYSLNTAVNALSDFWPLLPYCVAAAVAVAVFRGNRTVGLFAIYLGLALVAGIATRAGRGVSHNALFDLLIAAAALGGLFASALPRWLATLRVPPEWGAAAAALLLVLPLLPMAPASFQRHAGSFGGRRGVERSYRPVYAAIDASPGPVACEDPAFCYWGHKPNSIDFSNTAQVIRLDPAAAQALTDMLRRRVFQLIVLRQATTARFLDEQNAALAEAYVAQRTKPLTFYVPRP